MVAERVERYLVARIQSDVLLGELEAYERKHTSPLLDEAGVLLERLTRGRYVALGVTDRPSGRSLVIIGADEERREPSQLSEGTADQVFLALRLAGIASLQRERRASGAHTLPVVLDDVLMAFDDERAAAALRVMAELSQQWQVIVFSHHAHLADLAESLSLDALTVSRLVPPPEMDVMRTAQEIRLRARSAPPRMPAAPPRAAAPRPSDSSISRAAEATDPGAVRAWARDHGYAVGDRGRMAAEITAAYELAHPGPSRPEGDIRPVDA